MSSHRNVFVCRLAKNRINPGWNYTPFANGKRQNTMEVVLENVAVDYVFEQLLTTAMVRGNLPLGEHVFFE
jgi:hypothetical protein